ncbi:PREDICTED: uncharacterized protein LOC106122086 [Papilio xuthus]|uniref:Uncharacterized protein LOC106122086 n=1 Tax=Papilio xuthus TaxID=66420 RepID=A0AAJ6ZIR4_PAPXU|nr:PREDICTED: uncharacterized protein LOC106122086 [Papilio xuthus]
MYPFKLIAFFISALLVSELKSAIISCNCQNKPSPTLSSESDQSSSTITTQQVTTAVDDLMCLSTCPIMQESPVCGTNGVTYPSLGSLECAKSCGVDVNLVSNAPCPTSGLQLYL